METHVRSSDERKYWEDLERCGHGLQVHSNLLRICYVLLPFYPPNFQDKSFFVWTQWTYYGGL